MAPRPFCWPRREGRVCDRTHCVAGSTGGSHGALGRMLLLSRALAFARRDCRVGRRPSSSLAAQPRPELAHSCTAQWVLDAGPRVTGAGNPRSPPQDGSTRPLGVGLSQADRTGLRGRDVRRLWGPGCVYHPQAEAQICCFPGAW